MESKGNRMAGYLSGIFAGVSYGMNPLFAKHLFAAGVSVDTMLFLRYFIGVLIFGAWIVVRKRQLRLRANQIELIVLLSILFAMSSLLLFDAYDFIPSGVATAIVFLYPVFTALIMLFVGVRPDRRNWIAIAATFAGVVIMGLPSKGGAALRWQGMLLSALSGLSYAFYLVTVNRSRRLRDVKVDTLTFYVLLFGSAVFLVHHAAKGGSLFAGLTPQTVQGGYSTLSVWLNIVGLSVFPTIIALLTLSYSTRTIGPVKTSILGVFEPVTAMLIGTLLFGEKLTVNIVAGITIAVAAVVFMVAGGGKSQEKGESGAE